MWMKKACHRESATDPIALCSISSTVALTSEIEEAIDSHDDESLSRL
jgi:hypothetical protein